MSALPPDVESDLNDKDSRVAKLLQSGMPDDKIIEEAYLMSLSRYPTDQEMQSLLEILVAAIPTERRAAVEDLFWSILSSREFLFNH